MFKIPTEDRNKMADMKEYVEAENYFSNALLLKLVSLVPWLFQILIKKVGSGLIFLRVAFCFVFNNIS